MTAVVLGPKILLRTRVQAVNNRERSGYVDRQHAISTDSNMFFAKLILEATHFETMLKTVNEIIFFSVSLVCFTAELDEKTDSQYMYM